MSFYSPCLQHMSLDLMARLRGQTGHWASRWNSGKQASQQAGKFQNWCTQLEWLAIFSMWHVKLLSGIHSHAVENMVSSRPILWQLFTCSCWTFCENRVPWLQTKEQEQRYSQSILPVCYSIYSITETLPLSVTAILELSPHRVCKSLRQASSWLKKGRLCSSGLILPFAHLCMIIVTSKLYFHAQPWQRHQRESRNLTEAEDSGMQRTLRDCVHSCKKTQHIWDWS